MVLIKAQIAMEYMLVAGFVLMLTIPLVAVFVNQTTAFNNEVSLSQTYKALNKIIDSSNTVYYLGTPAKRTITVYFPSDIKSLEISNNSITANISSSFTFSVSAESELNGTLFPFEGLHTITVEAKESFIQIDG